MIGRLLERRRAAKRAAERIAEGQRKLQLVVDATKADPRTYDYAKRRAAALRHVPKVKVLSA